MRLCIAVTASLFLFVPLLFKNDFLLLEKSLTFNCVKFPPMLHYSLNWGVVGHNIDRFALVAGSPEDFQAMRNTVHVYARKWQYNLNASKSFVMAYGESSRSRTQARSSQRWHIGNEAVEETDEIHYLGILRSFSYLPSSAPLSEAQWEKCILCTRHRGV